MTTFVFWIHRLASISPDQIFGALNPHHWSSHVFLILILALVAAHALIPWPAEGATRFIEELLLILPAGLLYFFVRNFVGPDPSIAFDNAQRIISLEERLGIHVEPGLQGQFVVHHVLVNIVNWVYIWAHWPFILGWVLWMWFRHRSTYPLYRNAVLVSGAIGMMIFALYPLAPPRLVSDVAVVDTISLYSRSYRVFQPPALTNLYAAMPSLHFGWNLLVGIAIISNATSRPGKLLGFALPIAMFAAIVLTGNHYILDGIAGGAIALVGLSISAIALPQVRAWREHVSIPSIGKQRTNTPPGRY